jgi:hypothetical protein
MITQADLSQFTGTEHYYKYLAGLKLTDGVKYLAEKGACYWLLDIIASYQGSKALNGVDFQLWELKKTGENKARVSCKADNDLPGLITQDIEYTDFALDSVKLYCIDQVILLPSEY